MLMFLGIDRTSGGLIVLGAVAIAFGIAGMVMFAPHAKIMDWLRKSDTIIRWHTNMFIGDQSYGSPQMKRFNRFVCMGLIAVGTCLMLFGVVGAVIRDTFKLAREAGAVLQDLMALGGMGERFLRQSGSDC